MKKVFIAAIAVLFSGFVFGQEIKKVKITDLEKTIAESKTPLIVNFWATFCKPCLVEIPYFEEAVKKYKENNVQLLLVSLDLEDDYPAKIKTLAAKRKFNAPIQWLDEYNADYFIPKIDSAWSGAIPASLFVNNNTGYRHFIEEQISQEKLDKLILEMIKAD